MEWQPIKTAPRDGTYIIASDGNVTTITTWGKTSHVPIYGWLLVAWGDPQDADLLRQNLTHWMPLPAPPVEVPQISSKIEEVG
jgi:hypothetical protein